MTHNAPSPSDPLVGPIGEPPASEPVVKQFRPDDEVTLAGDIQPVRLKGVPLIDTPKPAVSAVEDYRPDHADRLATELGASRRTSSDGNRVA